MAWIEVHQTLPTHRKIKRLKRALKIKTAQAVGHVVMLWLWAIDNTPQGELAGLDAEDIAEAAEWGGDPQRFLQALTEAGFVDGGASLSLHDWQEYAGLLMDKQEVKKAQTKERVQRYRKRAKADDVTRYGNADVTKCNALHSVTEEQKNEDVTRYGNADVTQCNAPNLTIPNLTIPNSDDNTSCLYKQGVTASVTSGHRSRSDAVQYYYEKISPTPSSLAVSELGDFEKELGTALCVRAIDEALDNNVRTWKYVRAILARWKQDGVKNVQDLERREADRQNRRKSGGRTEDAVPDYYDTSDTDRLWEEMQRGEYT